MVKRDGAYTRAERLRTIRGFISGFKEPMQYKKTLAALMVKHGLKKETLREYLETIQDLGELDIDEEANTMTAIKKG